MGIAVSRADGQCISANEALGRIVGAERETSPRHRIFAIFHPGKIVDLLADAEQVLSGGMNNHAKFMSPPHSERVCG